MNYEYSPQSIAGTNVVGGDFCYLQTHSGILKQFELQIDNDHKLKLKRGSFSKVHDLANAHIYLGMQSYMKDHVCLYSVLIR